jgi:hypothetical protein
MRWQKQPKKRPEKGDVYWRKKFAFFPMEIISFDENKKLVKTNVWFETYYCKYTYHVWSGQKSGGRYWQEEQFLPEHPEVIQSQSALGKAMNE